VCVCVCVIVWYPLCHTDGYLTYLVYVTCIKKESLVSISLVITTTQAYYR